MKFLQLLILFFSITLSSDDNKCEEAKLYFVFPPDGYVSDGGSLKVVFGADNIAINPAGLEEDAVECVISGHHHLIINDEYNVSVFKDVAIPFQKNILHFGGAQTEAELSLPPGKYSLQLALGNYEHMPIKPFGAGEEYIPIISKKIQITISE